MRPFKSYHQQERQLKQIYTEQKRTSKKFIRKRLLAEQEILNLFIPNNLRLIIQMPWYYSKKNISSSNQLSLCVVFSALPFVATPFYAKKGINSTTARALLKSKDRHVYTIYIDIYEYIKFCYEV